MLSLLKEIGFPRTPLVWFIGAAMGFGANTYWTEQRVAALDAQKQQLAEQRTALEAQIEQQQRALDLATNSSCQPMKQQLVEAQGKVQQYAENIQAWSTAYSNVQEVNRQLRRASDLTQQLNDLREKWRTATRNAQEYAFVRCSDPSNSCDLNPPSQRRLRALEAERDQLHAQILDLQSHMACTKP